MDARHFLVKFYLEFRNDFLSVERFAEYHGLTKEQAYNFIALAREVAFMDHPES